MKSTLNRISISGILLLVIFITTFMGQVKDSHAQTDTDWSEPINLSKSGATSNPSMVVDNEGVIHTIWVDAVNGYMYAESKDGSNWSAPESVAFPFDPKKDSGISMIADFSGSIHFMWLRKVVVGIEDGAEIFTYNLMYARAFAIFVSQPLSWSVREEVLADSVLDFDATADEKSEIHVAYLAKQTADGNPAGIYYRRLQDLAWTRPIPLYLSQYFRTLTLDDAHIRIAAAGGGRTGSVYVVFDDRSVKRIFLTKSDDGGINWQESVQLQAPEDATGTSFPFNVNVSAMGNNVLLIWQFGQPRLGQCTVYSQWSVDRSANWEDPVIMLQRGSECPLDSRIIGHKQNFISILLIGQINPTLIAWNGQMVSDPQTQIQLPALSNPLTYDPLLFSCRYDLIYKQFLYVIGCDQGRSGDVWFLSRSLTPVENWFSPSSIWDNPEILPMRSEDAGIIKQFTSVTDDTGNVHAVWVNTSSTGTGNSNTAIVYARWNGAAWSAPQEIFSSPELPAELLALADPSKRLLVTWVDGNTGDLAYRWANIERANLYSEWSDGIGLPSPSPLIESPDGVVDSSGRIIMVFAVPINEGRGVYMIQSMDNGENWMEPVRAFDAVSAGWERVGRTRLSLGADGTLHLIFIRQATRLGQPEGLYYSRSVDGGATWSEPLVVSQSNMLWADIAGFDQTVHIVWQEYDGLVFANVSQVSQDAGLSWGGQNSVTGVNDGATQVALASYGPGLLHFIQLIKKENDSTIKQETLTLQDWEWDGDAWNIDLTQEISIKGNNAVYSLSADITSKGFLGVFIPVTYDDSEGKTHNEILTFSRFLAEPGINIASKVPAIPAATQGSVVNDGPALQLTPTSDSTLPIFDEETLSSSQRNIIGIVLIGIGLIVAFILVIRRSSGKKTE